MTNKRVVFFGLILTIGMFTLEFFLSRYSFEKKKSQFVLELIQSDKILSNELHRLFYGLENDFNFFERNITTILNFKRVSEHTETLIDFLNTHPHYFKVRLTDSYGKELFKIVQKEDRTTYEESKNLFDLSNQIFFKDLKKVEKDNFYFSSMEANVINGEIEIPVRATIRVSKRITLKNDKNALLIFNIDGKKILQLFDEVGSTLPNFNDKALIDHQGFYVASIPLLAEVQYTMEKVSLEKTTYQSLQKIQELQGSLDKDDDVIVYTKLPLPRSTENWFLISKIRRSFIVASIKKEQLTRIFWESLIVILLTFWFWRDENKRHKEQVVQVLLKERGEFIQNVSHQLKTPLTIIHNYLSDEKNIIQNSREVQNEVRHLIKVVEDLLLLSNIESLQQIPLVKENILEILNETIEKVAIKSKENFISIRVTLAEDLTHRMDHLNIYMLPDLLKSAFFNIIDNALDFSPKHGTIFIEIFVTRNERIAINISDSGPGVPKELIPKLFTPYSRDKSLPRKGSGLGLSISKKIIEIHKGEINYLQKETGATFQIIV